MALIDDILDYSKIDSGKLTLEKSLLDLVSIIYTLYGYAAASSIDTFFFVRLMSSRAQ